MAMRNEERIMYGGRLRTQEQIDRHRARVLANTAKNRENKRVYDATRRELLRQWVPESMDEIEELPSRIDSHGYVVCQKGGAWAPKHRLVMSFSLGRALERSEQVHHKDGDRTNNDLSNLQLRRGHHGSGASFRCRACGSCDIEAVPIAGRTS